MLTFKSTKFDAAKILCLYSAVFAATYFPARATVEAVSGYIENTYDLHLEARRTKTWNDEIKSYALRLQDAYGIEGSKAKQFSEWILLAAYEHNLSPDLISSVIMTESSFRTNVVSKAGAVGPVQVRPKYWSDSCGDLNNPLDNIRCGAMVLQRYSKEANGNVKVALKMYNVGPTNYRQNKMVDASNRYVTKIARHLAMLDNPTVVIR